MTRRIKLITKRNTVITKLSTSIQRLSKHRKSPKEASIHLNRKSWHKKLNWLLANHKI